MPGDKRNFTGWLLKTGALITLNATVKDKRAEYQLLANSDVNWTLIRCPIIKDEPYAREPHVSLVTPSAYSLRAGELASFIVSEVESGEFARQGPFLNSQ